MKAVWLSDLHFSADNTVAGLDTAKRIDAAVDFVNQYHADADICVITGDLVDRGTRRDYEALHQHLSTLACPLYPLVGNHDDRALLRSTFELPVNGMPDFVQYRIDRPDSILLCLDTQRTGADSGEFCAQREQWLAQQLAVADGKPVLLFMHHPPMVLGLPMQDSANLQNADSLIDLLASHSNIAYLFIGHVHRPICGTFRGMPFATMRAVSYQAPAPQPAWTWEQFAPAAEAPNLGVITTAGADVNLQYLQFSDYALGT